MSDWIGRYSCCLGEVLHAPRADMQHYYCWCCTVRYGRHGTAPAPYAMVRHAGKTMNAAPFLPTFFFLYFSASSSASTRFIHPSTYLYIVLQCPDPLSARSSRSLPHSHSTSPSPSPLSVSITAVRTFSPVLTALHLYLFPRAACH